MESKKLILSLLIAAVLAACSPKDSNNSGYGTNPPVPSPSGGGNPPPKPDPTDCEDPLQNLSEAQVQTLWVYLKDQNIESLNPQDRMIYQAFQVASSMNDLIHVTPNDCSETRFSKLLSGLVDENAKKRSSISTKEIVESLRANL